MKKIPLFFAFSLLLAACQSANPTPKDGENGAGKPAAAQISVSRNYSERLRGEIYPTDTAKVGADGFSYVYPDTFERLEDPQIIPFGDGYVLAGSWRRLKVISDEDFVGGDEPVEQLAGEKQLLFFDAAGKYLYHKVLDPYFGYEIAPFNAEKSIVYNVGQKDVSLLDMKTGLSERPLSVSGAISGVARINNQSFAVLYGDNGAQELDIIYRNLRSTLQQKSRLDSAWMVFALAASEKTIAATYMGNANYHLVAFSAVDGKELWRINLPKKTPKGEEQRMAGKNNVAISPVDGTIALLTHRQLPNTRSECVLSLFSPDGKLQKEQVLQLIRPQNDDIDLIVSRIQALNDGSWLVGGTHYPEKGFNHGWGVARLGADLQYVGGTQVVNGENSAVHPQTGHIVTYDRGLMLYK